MPIQQGNEKIPQNILLWSGVIERKIAEVKAYFDDLFANLQTVFATKKYVDDNLGSSISGAVPITRKVNGHPLSTDVTVTVADTGAEPKLNGTGFVKSTGTTTSYDNNTYSTDIHANITALNAVANTNTGDQTLSGLGGVPTSRTVNGHALTGDVVVTAADASAEPKLNGTGFVKSTGTTTSYDNNTYLTTLSGAMLLDQTTQQTTNGMPIFAGAGNVYLEIKSTDHLIAGLKISRATYSSDIYSDILAYITGSTFKIDQIASDVTTNYMSLTSALATFPGSVQGNGYGANGCQFKGYSASGTLAAPGDTLADQYMLFFGASGRVTNFLATTQGLVAIKAAENFNATSYGTYITFETTGKTTTTRLERMRISDNGNVGIGGTANVNAILDLTSTTKAFMPPRMTTTQRDAISTPTEGMVIYNLTTHVLNFHNGTGWYAV